jgi:hypothetical protein
MYLTINKNDRTTRCQAHLCDCLGVFPVTHAVTVVYISLGHKNMPLVSATSFSRTNGFDVANISIYF